MVAMTCEMNRLMIIFCQLSQCWMACKETKKNTCTERRFSKDLPSVDE